DDLRRRDGVELALDLPRGGLRESEGRDQRADAKDGAEDRHDEPPRSCADVGGRLRDEVLEGEAVGAEGAARPREARQPHHSSVNRPSEMRMLRRARSATAASCVITMSVSPSALSSSKSDMTSPEVRWSRLPVGSSARSSCGPLTTA